MNIDGKAWRTIWLEAGGRSIAVIDQTQLPHAFTTRSIHAICHDIRCGKVVEFDSGAA